MPMYDYECGACGHADVEFHGMHAEPLAQCPACLAPNYMKQVSRTHGENPYRTPIELYSIALNTPEEIAAFKARCPEVECNPDLNDPMGGIPVARNRKQKLAALKAVGHVEVN